MKLISAYKFKELKHWDNILEIYEITQGHRYWNRTIDYAENCLWRAGKFLAEKMRNNEFLSWERVFVALINDRIVGYCTFAEKDELPDKYTFSPFIGFVFVDEKYRGNRISEKLIKKATDYAINLGYKKVYIMSGEKGLYEKYGFEKIGDFETVYNSVDQLFVKTTIEVLK